MERAVPQARQVLKELLIGQARFECGARHGGAIPGNAGSNPQRALHPLCEVGSRGGRRGDLVVEVRLGDDPTWSKLEIPYFFR